MDLSKEYIFPAEAAEEFPFIRRLQPSVYGLVLLFKEMETWSEPKPQSATICQALGELFQNSHRQNINRKHQNKLPSLYLISKELLSVLEEFLTLRWLFLQSFLQETAGHIKAGHIRREMLQSVSQSKLL